MRVHYRTGDGGLRYLCDAAKNTLAAPTCFCFEGEGIDRAVVEAFFAAVKPSEIALLEEVLEARSADREKLLGHHKDRVKGATYEARLAEKRYRSVDPENRLVAAELEKGWEAALRNLADAKEGLERFEWEQLAKEPAIDPALREQLMNLGRRLPELWESGRLRVEHKKELLRSLISRIILSRPFPDTIEVRIVWISGAVSPITIRPRITRSKDLSEYPLLVEKILKLAQEGYTDGAIARILTEEGFRSARNTEKVPVRFVGKVRREHDQSSLIHQFRSKEKVGGKWTVLGLSRELGVSRNWFYKKIENGTIPAERNPLTGHYLIEDDPKLLEQLRTQIDEKRRT